MKLDIVTEDLEVVVQLPSTLNRKSIYLAISQEIDSNLLRVSNCILIAHKSILIRCILINVLEHGFEIRYLTRSQVDNYGVFFLFNTLYN